MTLPPDEVSPPSVSDASDAHFPEPIWVPLLAVKAAQFDQLQEHGGLHGIRDANALAAALARPQQRWHYEPSADLASLAAAYAFALATAHPFADGNRRAAYVTAEVFLALNGYSVSWPDEAVVKMMMAVAAGEADEIELAVWFREGLVRDPSDHTS